MSAGNCPRCGGDKVHPSKVDPSWSVWCELCNRTGNYPPTFSLWSRFVAWLRRGPQRRDDAIDRLGSL